MPRGSATRTIPNRGYSGVRRAKGGGAAHTREAKYALVSERKTVRCLPYSVLVRVRALGRVALSRGQNVSDSRCSAERK